MAIPKWIYIIEIKIASDQNPKWEYAEQDSASFNDSVRKLRSLQKDDPYNEYRMHLYTKWSTIK